MKNLVIGLSNDKRLYITDTVGNELQVPKIIFCKLSERKVSFNKERLILKHLEMMGTAIINPIDSILNCANKIAHLQILCDAGLQIINTLCSPSPHLKKLLIIPQLMINVL